MSLAFLLVGIGLLVAGGDLLVRHAGQLARSWGLPPLVIGLTVVAFGTSAPELAASLTAALAGSPEIAMGNVVGSNIANVALILGVTALVTPLTTEARFLTREMPVMVGAALLLVALAADGSVGRAEAALLVLLLGGYLWLLLGGDEAAPVEEEFDRAYGAAPEAPVWRAGVGAVLGLIVLIGGARLLVLGATALARAAEVPELVIGVTVVAVGTSLPELATSIIAAVKRQPDLALGNVVGSNVFNVLAILGLTALAQPIRLPFAAVAPDLVVMVLASLVLWPFLATGRRLGRVEAGLLVALYLAYVAWRFMA